MLHCCRKSVNLLWATSRFQSLSLSPLGSLIDGIIKPHNQTNKGNITIMYTGPLLTPPSLRSLSFFVFLCRQNKNTDYFSQLGECRTKAAALIKVLYGFLSKPQAYTFTACCEHRSFYVVSADALLWYQIVLWVTHIHSHSYCVLFSSNTLYANVSFPPFSKEKSSILVSQMYSVLLVQFIIFISCLTSWVISFFVTGFLQVLKAFTS